MRFRIHHALFAAFLGIVGLLVVLAVLLTGSRLRDELVHLMEEELRRELFLVGMVALESGNVGPDRLAGAVTQRIGYRTTILDVGGTVLGDSDVEGARIEEVEDHADRPEIRAARETGQVAFAERESATVGQRLLYAAVPGTLNGEPVTFRIAAPLQDVEAAVRRSQRAVAGAGLLAMLVALVVAWGLARRLARPLVLLSDRAGRLAAGEFDARAPRIGSVAELDELSTAFNRLAHELETRLAELSRERDEMQALIDTIAEGVVALTEDARILRTNRAARELLRIPEPTPYAPVGSVVRHPDLREILEESVVTSRQAREVELGNRHLIVASRVLEQGGAVTTFLDITELRRLERVRRDFVANASHELKTPLTSIRGFAETLLDGEPPPDLRRRFLEAIRENTLRLQHLIDDLLDLSRLESGGWQARSEVVEVAQLAARVWEDFADRAEARDMEFTISGDARAVADEQGLEQILRNLLDNALRYTPAEGRVEVQIADRHGRVEVAVADTGTGIPSRALPRIFERFYRADTSRAREVGGTGLGLAIVRHLVGAMGGEVWAESELGGGTTIRFTLPAA